MSFALPVVFTTCRFSCLRCRLNDQPFAVRAREPGEPIVAWIELEVRPALKKEHDRSAPWCKSTTADLQIPIEGETIGGAARH